MGFFIFVYISLSWKHNDSTVQIAGRKRGCYFEQNLYLLRTFKDKRKFFDVRGRKGYFWRNMWSKGEKPSEDYKLKLRYQTKESYKLSWFVLISNQCRNQNTSKKKKNAYRHLRGGSFYTKRKSFKADYASFHGPPPRRYHSLWL